MSDQPLCRRNQRIWKRGKRNETSFRFPLFWWTTDNRQPLAVNRKPITDNQQLTTVYYPRHDKNTDGNPCEFARERSQWIRRRRMPDGKIGEIRCPCFSLTKGAPNWSSKSAIYGNITGRSVFLSWVKLVIGWWLSAGVLAWFSLVYFYLKHR